MSLIEKLLLAKGLDAIKDTDVYGLLKEFKVIPTDAKNADVYESAVGAVWPGIH